MARTTSFLSKRLEFRLSQDPVVYPNGSPIENVNEHAILWWCHLLPNRPKRRATEPPGAGFASPPEARWRWRHKATGILRDIISDIRGYPAFIRFLCEKKNWEYTSKISNNLI